MQEPTGGASDDFIRVCRILADKLDKFDTNRHGDTSNRQTISVNAGGPAVWIAVWIASICCAVMLTLTMISRADQIDQKRRLDVANDKLSVILQWAPELAKKVDQQVSDKHKGEAP